MFELKRKTTNGKFSIKLYRQPSLSEAEEITKLSFKIIELLGANTVPVVSDTGPINLETAIREGLHPVSKTLGFSPRNEIMMGSYEEPSEGLIIQMLDYPKCDMKTVVNKLCAIAPISGTGWVHILRGNHCTLKFTPEVAAKILTVFREHDIYAKIRDLREEAS